MDAGRANILVCKDAKSASQEAAERFACAAIRSVAERGGFFVAVCGGRDPVGMYETLAGREFVEIVPWVLTELFFTDERCVPPESEDSNYRLVYRLLLSTVPIPAPNIHRFKGEDPPEAAAAAYEREIHEVMGTTPRFDLIVLGLGDDAHVASLFPNTPVLHEAGRHAVAGYVEQLGAHRLTLTFPVINHARQVIILALGSGKAEALAVAMKGPLDVNLHPVQGVDPKSGHLLWIVDNEAASGL
jgi:6-phosphogluconolactonase